MCGVAVGLWWASAYAAEPVSPLVGATREQVISRLGEPKSQLAAGNRVVLLYARERIVLRDNVVVEVEPLAAEPVRRPSESNPSAPAGTPSAPTPATTAGSTAAPAANTGAGATPPTESTATASSGRASALPSTPTPAPAPPPEPKLEIKLIVPPSAKDARPASTDTTTTTSGTAPSGPAPAPATNPSAPTRSAKSDPPAPVVPPPTSDEEVTTATSEAVTVDPAEAAKAAKAKKIQAQRAARKHLDGIDTSDPLADVFNGRTFAIAAAIIVGGIGFLIWRYRQRQLDLAATSVSNTPLATPLRPAPAAGTTFTALTLEKLDPRQFDALVAAYYSKTGVIAERTGAAPGGPVQIKISWKGEPRPFAYVKCIAQPTGLIEVEPLKGLAAALAADDIRRGYVVTTGKFSVSARDFAEEKHITLLPGDIFLQKLNDLPASARSEIGSVVRVPTATPFA